MAADSSGRQDRRVHLEHQYCWRVRRRRDRGRFFGGRPPEDAPPGRHLWPLPSDVKGFRPLDLRESGNAVRRAVRPRRAGGSRPAVPILEQVAYSALNGAAKLDASPSGTLVYENGGSDAGLVTLQWLEEGGKTRPLLAKPGNYGRPSFSPDGRRLALEILDGSNRDIWVQDLERDTATRLTFDGKASGPIWTPDGRSVVFQDPEGLSWTRADGGGKPQPLLRTKGLAWPWSFTPDGKRLAYFELGAGSYDLWTVPIEGDSTALRAGKPEVLLQTPFDERYPAFSPDGRWLAYVSNESGAYEIYVRAFPEAASGGGKWQISSGGGAYPMWSRTGRQLFFETLDNRVMVAAYTVQGNSFVAEKPRLWSERQLSNLSNTSRNIDLAPDGKRFAVILPAEEPGSQQRFKGAASRLSKTSSTSCAAARAQIWGFLRFFNFSILNSFSLMRCKGISP